MPIKRSPSESSIEPQLSALLRPNRFLDLYRTASSQTLTRTSIAVAVAWVPLALLSIFRGGHSFLSFLTDYAVQSRFLIIIPMLTLTEPLVRSRHELVVRHFETFLIPHDLRQKFRQDWKSCEKRQDSKLAWVVLALLTYATMTWLGQYLSPNGAEFMDWWKGAGGYRFFSLAGTWAVFVSYPVLFYLVLVWLWKQLLWVRFLRSTTRLKLRLVPAHPDQLGGLGFIEESLRGQLTFSFCMGVGIAGAVANRVFHDGERLSAFRNLPLFVIGAVFLICVAPYFLFTGTLMQMRRQGMARYGAFARAVGEQFEKKWLDRAVSLNEDVLTVPDFSTTADLYSVVDNIGSIRLVPVSMVDIYAFLFAALAPGIPVVIAAIPFDTVMRAAVKLLS